MLDERKTAILRAVVQEYIATAQPVGSTHIANAPGVQVSSATVRNEMAVLEQEGYLVQPHTSAGRVPTDKGYRFFVDHLTAPGRLDVVATPAGRGLLRRRPRRARADAAPDHPPARRSSPTTPPWWSARRPSRPTVRSVQLVGLSRPRRAVVVAVLSQRLASRTDHRARRPTPSEVRVGRRHGAPAAHVLGRHRHRRAPSAARQRRRRASTSCARPRSRHWRPAARPTSRCTWAARRSMAQAFDAVETVRTVLQHPRAAVRRGVPRARRARPGPVGGHRRRARRASRSPPARSSWRP